MAANPLFSIIIPTHNRAKMLSAAIQSVVEQEYENWEIRVIDDGSTDNTKEIVSAFKQSKIHYTFQECQERSAARNKGIEQAKGTYFCFLDDDDYFLPQHLLLLQQKIEIEKSPIAVFRTGMLVERKKKRQKTPFFLKEQNANPISFFLQNMAGIHTLCFHHQILEKFNFDTRWIHFQDTHLLIRALLAYPFFQLEAYTCVYVRYDNMGSLNAFRREDAEKRTANNIAAIRDLFRQGGKELQGLLSPGMEDFLVCQKYLDHANGALQVGKFVLSRTYFRQSIKANKRAWLLLEYAKYLIRYLLAGLKNTHKRVS